MHSRLILFFIASILFTSCGQKPKKNQAKEKPVFKSDTTHFDFKLDVFDAVIYKDKLILLEFNSLDTNMHFRRRAKDVKNSKSKVIDLLTNKEDTLFHVPEKIIDIKVTRDSLWAKHSNEEWFVLENNNWIKKEIYPNKFHKEFKSNSKIYYGNNILHETDKYYIYSYDVGEFGHGILFLNKNNGELRGAPINSPIEINVIDSVYYFKTEYEHMTHTIRVSRMKYPDSLHSINHKELDFNSQYYSLVKSLYHNELECFDIYLKSTNQIYIIEPEFPDTTDGDFEQSDLIDYQENIVRHKKSQEWFNSIPEASINDNLYNIFSSDSYDDSEIYPGPTFKHKNQVHHVFYDYTDSISQIYTQTSANGLLDTTQNHFDIVDVPINLNDIHFKDKSIVGLTNNTIVIVSNDHIKRYTFKK